MTGTVFVRAVGFSPVSNLSIPSLLGELSVRRTGVKPAQELFFRARREVLVNVNRVKEIRQYFKRGFLLFMSDAAASEIVVRAPGAPAAPADSWSVTDAESATATIKCGLPDPRRVYPGVIRTQGNFAWA
jgi:hypothetical protein